MSHVTISAKPIIVLAPVRSMSPVIMSVNRKRHQVAKNLWINSPMCYFIIALKLTRVISDSFVLSYVIKKGNSVATLVPAMLLPFLRAQGPMPPLPIEWRACKGNQLFDGIILILSQVLPFRLPRLYYFFRLCIRHRERSKKEWWRSDGFTDSWVGHSSADDSWCNYYYYYYLACLTTTP